MNEEKEVKEQEAEAAGTEEVREAEEVKKEEKAEEKRPEEKKLFHDSKKKLQEEIEQLKGELAIAKNNYYKAYADADNLKKRLIQEKEISDKYRIQSFVLDILPSIDALEMALNNKDVNDPFVKGVKLTYDSIMNALTKEGVTPIEVLNKPFDPNQSHAIMTEKIEGVEPNIVVEVLQKGYMLKDRLLRAALVKVSE
ncbi:MAG: nucleotide exchange factor GrpE [Erysipelotrichaceae bacterium]|nr:nucleotide exchange factor GrpE [Erysipelotrichaceae bacterium]